MKKVFHTIFNFYILEVLFAIIKIFIHGHKFIELSDIESLRKENITIKSVKSDFNNISKSK